MEPDYRDRTLFYWAKLYTSELKSGEEYGNLKTTELAALVKARIAQAIQAHTGTEA